MRAMLASLVLLAPAIALACPPVTVKSVTLQEGMYRARDCQAEVGGGTYFDECMCKGSVAYPVVSSPAGDLSAVNADIRDWAEQWQCEGDATTETSEMTRTHERIATYKTIFNQHPVVTLELLGYEYGAGAAHGITGIRYIVIEKMTGRRLSTADMVDLGKRDEINEYILRQLKAKPETFYGNGDADAQDYAALERSLRCSDCVGVDAKGVFVAYGQYEVAPYSAGEVRVYLPQEYVPNKNLHHIYRNAEGK